MDSKESLILILEQTTIETPNNYIEARMKIAGTRSFENEDSMIKNHRTADSTYRRGRVYLT